MRAQKNQKDAATTEHHLSENEVDFEFLWRCISKIPNQFGMATYPFTPNGLKCEYTNGSKFKTIEIR